MILLCTTAKNTNVCLGRAHFFLFRKFSKIMGEWGSGFLNAPKCVSFGLKSRLLGQNVTKSYLNVSRQGRGWGGHQFRKNPKKNVFLGPSLTQNSKCPCHPIKVKYFLWTSLSNLLYLTLFDTKAFWILQSAPRGLYYFQNLSFL